MYHFVYKTINLKNGKYYIGVHSTDNINDGYLGSGKFIGRAINKHGSENFERQILEYFSNREDALKRESELVTEDHVLDRNCYNMTPGGGAPPIWSGENHHFFGKKRPDSSKRMKENNPVYLPHVHEKNCSTKVVYDPTTGKNKRVDKNDHSLPSINKGKSSYKNKDTGEIRMLSKYDPLVTSGEFVHSSKGTFVAKNRNGHTVRLTKEDERYKSGEYIHFRSTFKE